MHIKRLSSFYFSHLYITLFICITTCLGSWSGITALCKEVGWCCTVAVSALCSINLLSGCEYTVKRSCTPLRYQNGAYMSIYGHMQPYIHTFKCLYKLQTYKCIILHLYVCLFVFLHFYVCIYICI